MLPFKNIFPTELDNNLGCASLGTKVSSALRSRHSLVTSTVVYPCRDESPWHYYSGLLWHVLMLLSLLSLWLSIHDGKFLCV